MLFCAVFHNNFLSIKTYPFTDYTFTKAKTENFDILASLQQCWKHTNRAQPQLLSSFWLDLTNFLSISGTCPLNLRLWCWNNRKESILVNRSKTIHRYLPYKRRFRALVLIADIFVVVHCSTKKLLWMLMCDFAAILQAGDAYSMVGRTIILYICNFLSSDNLVMPLFLALVMCPL